MSENKSNIDPSLATGDGELPSLIRAFNEVTGRLERTHAQLNGEVVRLRRELSSANEEIARSKRLAALGEMAAGIAHEIRNPLAAIALDSRALRGVDDEQSNAAERIRLGVKQIDRIVVDVLAFAREVRIRPERISLASLFDDAVASVAELAMVNGISIERDESLEAIDWEVDALLLRQAITNVLRNGIEAMAESAIRPGVIVTNVSIRDGSHLVLSVRDAGPGIADDVLARMFNPFFTTRAAGTGLGLAIVHRIVDAHGGRVVVRNNEPASRGATVELILPDLSRTVSSGASVTMERTA